MDVAKERVEDYLSVGEQNFLEVMSGRGWTKRVKSRFRGWVSEEYILMDSPVASDETSYLLKDAPCVVRFIHEGCAFGFDTKILDWCDMGFPFFRVGWPKNIKVQPVRKHGRIPVHLSCTIAHSGGEDRGVIEDLSSGGCGLVAPRQYEDGTPLRLSFELPDGFPVNNLQATVCRSRPQKDSVFIGCTYTDEHEGDYNALFFFVTTTLSRMGLEPLAERRVLVIHPGQIDVTNLLHSFDVGGVHAISATNMVDAFYRLRMATPGAILLHVRQPEFSVAEVCTAIRHTPGFGTIPMFLMGGDERDESLVSRCGAQDWFSQACVQNDPGKIAAACGHYAAHANN